MITEFFTSKEIVEVIFRDCSKLIKKLIPENNRLKKEFIKRKHSLSYPFVFSKYKTITYNGNTYIAVYGSCDNKADNFSCNIFLVLNTSFGKRYYEILIADGTARLITKHFIDRFIERSSYPVNKDNLLLYLSKDRCFSPSVMGERGKRYKLTNSGLVIHTDDALVTYINKDDLSLYKGEIEDDLDYICSQLSQADRISIYKENLGNSLAKNKMSYVNKR